MEKTIQNKINSFGASGFGFGFMPFASGTFGTIPAFLFHIFIIKFTPLTFRLSVFVIAFIFFLILSVFLSDWAIKYWKHKDPKEFVLDEIVAYLLLPVFFYNESSLIFAIICFFVFRFFDIFKPPIARGLDKKNGGIYIVLDDLVSAVYSVLTIYILKLSQLL